MTIREKILVIEDEKSISHFISTVLNNNGYEAMQAQTGEEALSMISSHCPDLVILDLGLPDMDGLDILRSLRSWSSLPVVVVSARSHERDKVAALDLGADDYLTKPFRLGELRARVAAHLRRQHRTPQHRFRRGGLDFDLGEKAVYWGEQPVKLTRGEYAICEYLALHSGQTFSKEQIYEAVFGFDAPGDQAAVTEHIKNIRAKLRALDCHPIDTVWGVGYRWKRDLP